MNDGKEGTEHNRFAFLKVILAAAQRIDWETGRREWEPSQQKEDQLAELIKKRGEEPQRWLIHLSNDKQVSEGLLVGQRVTEHNRDFRE